MVRPFAAGGPYRSHDRGPQTAVLGPEAPHVEVVSVDFGWAICAHHRGPVCGNRPLCLRPFQAGHDGKAIRSKSLRKEPSSPALNVHFPFGERFPANTAVA